MHLPYEEIEKLIDFKKQLSVEINSNFNQSKFNLIVAVSDAALNALLDEMLKTLTANRNKPKFTHLADFIEIENVRKQK
ncbi:hypothetical protein [Methylophilus sp. QUAN]|uniref:hypothetical protein n=1 Tax=Methylophilus sp. QUAN TaxID=2781020 RepID=UPI00188E9F7F|nr:hypothetical protein [Methylophilus sp. QUAN]MBF4990948.1 hypothetical protein [Methylophilus sp. QUAN]